METQNGMEITRTTDLPAPQSPATRQAGALGRDTGFSLAGSDYAVTYGFDPYGRFHRVSSSVQSVSCVVQYSRFANSDLLSGMTASSGFLCIPAYEYGRSLITSVENRFGETVISSYTYAYDHQGRMAWKEISRKDAKTQSWEVEKTASILWDGYKIVQASMLSARAWLLPRAHRAA